MPEGPLTYHIVRAVVQHSKIGCRLSEMGQNEKPSRSSLCQLPPGAYITVGNWSFVGPGANCGSPPGHGLRGGFNLASLLSNRPGRSGIQSGAPPKRLKTFERGTDEQHDIGENCDPELILRYKWDHSEMPEQRQHRKHDRDPENGRSGWTEIELHAFLPLWPAMRPPLM